MSLGFLIEFRHVRARERAALPADVDPIFPAAADRHTGILAPKGVAAAGAFALRKVRTYGTVHAAIRDHMIRHPSLPLSFRIAYCSTFFAPSARRTATFSRQFERIVTRKQTPCQPYCILHKLCYDMFSTRRMRVLKRSGVILSRKEKKDPSLPLRMTRQGCHSEPHNGEESERLQFRAYSSYEGGDAYECEPIHTKIH